MTKTTELALILDQSGSMESIKAGTLEGVNAFLDQQKLENAAFPVRFTLTLFSTLAEKRHDSVPVIEIPVLDENSYRPAGGTALLDAIGITIDQLGKRLSETPEEERPGKVIVAIMTDGEENSSHDFSWDQISEKIRHQTEVYNWEFLFLGANQDAIATGVRMNIARSSSVNFYQQDGSSRIVLRAMSRSVSSKKAGLSEKPLAQLYAEEEANAGKNARSGE
jgi:uncharacterized protein YegL